MKKQMMSLVWGVVVGTIGWTAPGAESGRGAFSNGTVARCEEPVRVAESDGVRFVDFGKAAFGWLEVRGSGAGTVRLGEKRRADAERVDLKPGGTIRSAEVTLSADAFWRRVPLVADKRNTAGVNGRAIAVKLPPEVGVIMPFRYVELPPGWKARRQVVAWPMTQKVRFRSNDAALNELWDFCTYSIRATTYAGVYVDGDRERIPYEGDLYINMLGQLYGVDGDPTLARRTIRHLVKYPTWPTEWKQHLIMCVWEDWHFTGDLTLVRETYDVLKGEKLMLERAGADGLLPSGGRADLVDWPVGERDGYDMAAPCNAVVNAFHYRNLHEMADLARALGKASDAADFTERAGRVKAAFNASLFDAAQGLYVDGKGSRHASFHANVAALDFGLVPPERAKAVADFIERRGMACSPYFAQYYLEALFKAGRREAAIRLLTSRGPRSWLGMKDQGSTITMEAWSLAAKPNQDWNHAWGAAPANLLPRFLADMNLAGKKE